MKNLQLVDLSTQYQKIENEINEAVINVIKSTAFINGPEVKNFQNDFENYLNVKHVIPCANGTDALQIALMALGLEPGDEVITPSFTYIATAEVIGLLRLTPVFVDVDEDTFCIDPNSVREAISNKTKAIIPVHLYGHCAPMKEMLEISEEFGIPLIEDTAQGIGSDYIFPDGSSKKAGTMGAIGCTSFFPSKNLGCYGDGGAIMTNDDNLAKIIRMVSNHGQSKRYYHDVIGVNSRLDSIQAAILRVKLPHLDSYLKARQDAAAYYNSAFEKCDKIITPVVRDFTTHGFHQYTMKLVNTDREALMAKLDAEGIPSNIYYPLPIHLQKAFVGSFKLRVSLNVTEQLMKSVLSLPIHTEMDDEQLSFISNGVLNNIL
ncbi:MAG: DegT/DnrJ/EryC1/StrS family aminotransferase [Flavobacteriales bacterium]|nr:DegT/DnrJ/EryC1/StrS family aminotransferase [Flavobacteriales bacterium]